MPTRPSSELTADLHAEGKRVRDFLARAESLHDSGALEADDLVLAYEGALLSWCTAVERTLEDLFLGLLAGAIAPQPGNTVTPLIGVTSIEVAHGVVTGTRRYVDWLPLNEVEKRAKVFFADGKPFDCFENDDLRAVERLHTIRNAIAHKSGAALETFHKKMVQPEAIPLAERAPAGYLRGIHTGSQSRMELLMAQTAISIRKLCGT